jgi:hypothetical protein
MVTRTMPRPRVKARQPLRVFAAVLSQTYPCLERPAPPTLRALYDLLAVYFYTSNPILQLLCRQVNTKTHLCTPRAHAPQPTAPHRTKKQPTKRDHGDRQSRPTPFRLASFVPARRGIAHPAGAGSARRVRAPAGQHEQRACAALLIVVVAVASFTASPRSEPANVHVCYRCQRCSPSSRRARRRRYWMR